MSLHDKRFPNETPEYRAARDEVLKLEMDIRSQIDKLGQLRTQMPLGGKVPEDYTFKGVDTSGHIHDVKMSELFRPGKKTLMLYSYMFGPQAEKPCPACTSILDGFNGMIKQLEDRVNFYAVARSPIERFKEYATSRDWNGLKLLSASENSYSQDYFAETEDGAQHPLMNVFVKKNDEIYFFNSSELYFTQREGHPRHVDQVWPIWNLLDMTPEGRGTDWFPKVD